MLKHSPGQDGYQRKKSYALASLFVTALLSPDVPTEVDSGRKDKCLISLLPPARWSCNITCANVSFPQAGGKAWQLLWQA